MKKTFFQTIEQAVSSSTYIIGTVILLLFVTALAFAAFKDYKKDEKEKQPFTFGFVVGSVTLSSAVFCLFLSILGPSSQDSAPIFGFRYLLDIFVSVTVYLLILSTKKRNYKRKQKLAH